MAFKSSRIGRSQSHALSATNQKVVAGDPTVSPVGCRRRRRKVSPLARKGVPAPLQGGGTTIERTDFESRRSHQISTVLLIETQFFFFYSKSVEI